MSFDVDLHIHSHFAAATSPQLTLSNLAKTAKQKGIAVLGTGDFTHPVWLQELKENLIFDTTTKLYTHIQTEQILFMPTAEVCMIYTDGLKTKKIHLLILAPDFFVVVEINKYLATFGDLAIDGRPVLMTSCEEIVRGLHNISDAIEVIPAHIWTPWFGVMGSKFGYDSLESCFKDSMQYIHAIETGLSSDPLMNWYVFNDVAIVSFSDAHSLPRLGREATICSGEMSYMHILEQIRNNTFISTIEFFPEEGKYHFSGHRKHGFSVDAKEARVLHNICPICHRKLIEGVEKRVEDISIARYGPSRIEEVNKRKYIDDDGFMHYDNKKPFVTLVPLEEIIAAALNLKSAKTKKVQAIYADLITRDTELSMLLHSSPYIKQTYPVIDTYIRRVLKGQITITPGYDNTYGKINF